MNKKITIKELRKICEDQDKDIFYLNPIMRKISIYLTAVLIRTKITPNQITGLSILLVLFSSILLSFGNYYYSILSGLVLFLYVLFDCVDGEVARYRKYMHLKKGGNLGLFIEEISHPFLITVSLLSITYGIFNLTCDLRIFIFGFLSLISYLSHYVLYFTQKILPNNNFQTKINESIFTKIWRNIINFFSATFLETMVLISAILNQLYIFLIFYSLFQFFSLLYLGFTLFMNLRSTREI